MAGVGVTIAKTEAFQWAGSYPFAFSQANVAPAADTEQLLIAVNCGPTYPQSPAPIVKHGTRTARLIGGYSGSQDGTLWLYRIEYPEATGTLTASLANTYIGDSMITAISLTGVDPAQPIGAFATGGVQSSSGGGTDPLSIVTTKDRSTVIGFSHGIYSATPTKDSASPDLTSFFAYDTDTQRRLRGWKAEVPSAGTTASLTVSVAFNQTIDVLLEVRTRPKIVLLPPGTTSWTVPADWPGSGTVELIGAGGNGSQIANGSNATRSGGAGGHYAKKAFTAAVGSVIETVIGDKGSASDTRFGTSASPIALAKAGASANLASAGTSPATGSIGDVTYVGGDGAVGAAGGHGGGGGSGGPNGVGRNGGAATSNGAGGGGGGGGTSASAGSPGGATNVGGAGGIGPTGAAGGTGHAAAVLATSGFDGSGGGGGRNVANSPGGAGGTLCLWGGILQGIGGGGGGAGKNGNQQAPAGNGGAGGGGGGGATSAVNGYGGPGTIAISYEPATVAGGQKTLLVGATPLSSKYVGANKAARYVGASSEWASG